MNLFTYFCFIIPLTALAVHTRSEAESFCNSTNFTNVIIDIGEEVNADCKECRVHFQHFQVPIVEGLDGGVALMIDG